jgi:hypothetical protein
VEVDHVRYGLSCSVEEDKVVITGIKHIPRKGHENPSRI